MALVDKEYPGTAVARMQAARERARSRGASGVTLLAVEDTSGRFEESRAKALGRSEGVFSTQASEIKPQCFRGNLLCSCSIGPAEVSDRAGP